MTMPGGTSSPRSLNACLEQVELSGMRRDSDFQTMRTGGHASGPTADPSCRVLNPPAGLVTARANKD